MTIIPISAFNDNYIWLLINDKHQCVCIDPGDAAPVISYLNKHQLKLTDILITHHHYDHIGGVEKLIKNYNYVNVYGPIDERMPQVTKPLIEGDVISIYDLDFQILSIPGHTSSHIAYYCPASPMIFCGDTLFSAGCGRVFDGTMDDLFRSIQKITCLPDTTKIYCAHEYTLNNCIFAQTIEPDNKLLISKINYLNNRPGECSLPSTLATEKQINPFVRAVVQTLRSKYSDHLSAYDSFKTLRHLKDKF